MLIPKIYKSLESIILWLNKNGWSGFDPYDIKANKGIIKITRLGNRNKAFAIIREIVFEILYTFPKFSRRILAVKPEINAKAMGLFASSYLTLYKQTKESHYLGKAQECFNWLDLEKVESNGGIGWGYPFGWQSASFIPAKTPNGIVTTAVGEAYWEYYQFSKDKTFLELCTQIATFLNSLPCDKYKEGICFSYTPLYKNHVHNLNLFVAEFLIKVGMETGNNNWIERGNLATTYTLLDQREDGSFDYNGPPEKPQNFVDNYHTGFVLRMLNSIHQLTGRTDVKTALDKCYVHYKDNFFQADGLPKLMPSRKYRVDIHSSAEAINCLSQLSSVYPESLHLAEKVLLWTIKHMQDKKGYFYYAILKSRITHIPFKSKIAYIRWGQAWMLKALSTFLYYKD